MDERANTIFDGPVRVNSSDRPRVGRDFRVRAGDTPDSRWLVNGELTVLLNDSAAEIITRCDGCHSVDALIKELNEVYAGASAHDIAEGVQAFLALAVQKGWIDIGLH